MKKKKKEKKHNKNPAGKAGFVLGVGVAWGTGRTQTPVFLIRPSRSLWQPDSALSNVWDGWSGRRFFHEEYTFSPCGKMFPRWQVWSAIEFFGWQSHGHHPDGSDCKSWPELGTAPVRSAWDLQVIVPIYTILLNLWCCQQFIKSVV